MSEESLSPEEQAEEIFKSEIAKVDANGDDCPLGDDCPVHFRVDEELMNDHTKFGRIITYVGDYVVLTTDNAELQSPVVILKALLGDITTMPPMYETCVIRVGDGALADLRARPRAEQLSSIRFVQKHDSWENFKEAHSAIVSGVREDLIDLSKPASPSEG